jgi:23S rRNA (cytosine1962-C5)-methyltransferase
MSPAIGKAPVKTMLRLRVTAAAESAIRSGHPWVFAESLREQNRKGRLGELAAVYDRKDRFLAIGLFDPDSPLRVRVLHAGNPVAIDAAWWRERLRQAIARRDGLFDEQTTGYRWINGESDGWPGLVLDRYDTTLVLKLYTVAWLPRLKEVVDLIGGVLPASYVFSGGSAAASAVLVGALADQPGCSARAPNPARGARALPPTLNRYPAACRQEQPASATAPDRKSTGGFCQQDAGGRLVLRLSRNIEETARTKFQLADGKWLLGDRRDACPTFLENGLRFEADVVRGQKTGFFLDQRENRRTVESLAQDRDVLNAFSFTGGFSVYAARGGARSVTDLDISRYAMTGSKRNFALNSHVSRIASCHHEMIHADAFEWIDQGPKRGFDFVILDPPSLAKRESERSRAIQAYRKLAGGGIQRLKRGGILAAASCSAHVSAEEFFTAVRQAAKASRRKFTELRTTSHGTDHPASFPEAHYLKCIYLKF